MKRDLDLIIEFYEAEKQLLEQCIHDNITDVHEKDYLHAHYHQEALHKVKTRLSILNGFKGPLYGEERQLEYLKLITDNWDSNDRFLSDSLKERLTKLYQRDIEKKEQEIEEIKSRKSPFVFDNQEVDDALFDLYEGKITGFKFYLSRKINFYLNFAKTADGFLIITIDITEAVEENFSFDEEFFNTFRGLGFTSNESRSRLIWRYNMHHFKDALTVKQLMARIIYEVLGQHNCDSPAELIYKK